MVKIGQSLILIYYGLLGTLSPISLHMSLIVLVHSLHSLALWPSNNSYVVYTCESLSYMRSWSDIVQLGRRYNTLTNDVHAALLLPLLHQAQDEIVTAKQSTLDAQVLTTSPLLYIASSYSDNECDCGCMTNSVVN
jgi:hypothetical protein